MRGRRWAVVIPVKPLATAKTRLRGAAPGLPHERLVLAFALDCATAAVASRAVAEVLVVTDDPVAAKALGEVGAFVVPDEPGAGLNAALRYGAGLLSGPVAALAGDLPALRPAELAGALDAAGAHARAFVADATGGGTVLLTAAGAPLDPRFGAGSARAHTAAGAVPLDGAWPSLRLDVDTAEDLARATALGLGAHTRAALATLR